MLGAETGLTREEFFDYGRRFATSYERTIAGTAPQVADHLEEVFEATGSRGGFMLGHVVSMRRRSSPKVDDKLVPMLVHRRDDADRDQCGDQPVFDPDDAALVVPQFTQCTYCPALREAELIRLGLHVHAFNQHA
jgi:hypothetical protein